MTAAAVLILFVTMTGHDGLVAAEMPDRARCTEALHKLLAEKPVVTGGVCLDLMPRVSEALPQ